MTTTITACTMDCPDACSLVVEQQNDGRILLRGNPNSPLTSGFTCPKFKGHIKRLQHPGRIRHPLQLLTLVRRSAIHSQILLEDQDDVPPIWVAPDNPVLADIDRSSDVYLVSPLGLLKINLHTMPGLHPKVVLYRRGVWMNLGGGVNQLISAAETDLGSGAPFYDQQVRLENGDR